MPVREWRVEVWTQKQDKIMFYRGRRKSTKIHAITQGSTINTERREQGRQDCPYQEGRLDNMRK